jgi:hypothetical protein
MFKFLHIKKRQTDTAKPQQQLYSENIHSFRSSSPVFRRNARRTNCHRDGDCSTDNVADPMCDIFLFLHCEMQYPHETNENIKTKTTVYTAVLFTSPSRLSGSTGH